MGSFGKTITIICLIGSLLFEETHSLTCSSQTFKNKKAFPHCQDLPIHNAFLHWNYNPKNSSLSIAYLAPPPKAGGWVAWAVNPSRPGMIGGQAFIASLFKGAPNVRTYNLTSYSLVLPSPTLSFPFWDLAAEFADDQFTIFVTVKVPADAKSLNQVWQAGPGVNPGTGFPMPHALEADNMEGESELVFDDGSSGGGGGGDGDSPAPKAHEGASVAPAPSADVVLDNETTSGPTAPAAAEVNETASGATAPASAEVNETATTGTAAAPAPGGSDNVGAAGIRSTNLGFIVGLFVFIWGINSF